MVKNRAQIVSKNSNEEPVTVYVKKPSPRILRKAKEYAARAFRDAVRSGAIFRAEIDKIMRKRGLWDDSKQAQMDELDKKMGEALVKLKKGGIKLSEGRETAINIRMMRFQKTVLFNERQQFDDFTAESQAESVRDDYLASKCIVTEEDQQVFENIDKLRDNIGESYVIEATNKLSQLMYELADDWQAQLPENQFLKKHGFINDELQLIDKEGNLVDIQGRKINTDYNLINEDNQIVNEEGIPVDKDGLPIVDTLPFLDDEGKPIEV